MVKSMLLAGLITLGQSVHAQVPRDIAKSITTAPELTPNAWRELDSLWRVMPVTDSVLACALGSVRLRSDSAYVWVNGVTVLDAECESNRTVGLFLLARPEGAPPLEALSVYTDHVLQSMPPFARFYLVVVDTVPGAPLGPERFRAIGSIR